MSDSRQFQSTVAGSPEEILGDHCAGRSIGKYRLVRRLGKGGVGVVYEAIDPILDRAVAIKVLRDGMAAQPDAVRKFLREARTAARLNHPNVVAVYEADQEKGLVYLVMELMEGGSAHDRIRQWGPFPWPEATQVMVDACKGLVAVHAAGMIHRDIKPSNVMRALDGTVKLADFGLASAFEPDANPLNRDGQVVGTPLYMSPEQCQGLKLDPRSDIYSLGATFFNLLTGEPPFQGNSAMEIMQGHCARPAPDPRQSDERIPAGCADLVLRMLSKNPDDRPRDALEASRELEALVSALFQSEQKPLAWNQPISEPLDPTPSPDFLTTRAEEIVPHGSPPARPSPTRWWLVALGLTLMMGAYAIGRHFSRDKLPPPIEVPVAVIEHPVKDSVVIDDSYPGRVVLETSGPVTALAFHGSDYTVLAWGTKDGEQRIARWRTRDDQPPLTAGGVGAPACRQISYWPFRKSWALLANNQVRLIAATPAKQDLPGPLGVRDRDVTAFALHPSLSGIAFSVREKGDAERGGIVWRRLPIDATPPGDVLWNSEDRKACQCLEFSRDGRYLLSGQWDGMVRRWIAMPERTLPGTKPEAGGSLRIGFAPVTAIAALDEQVFAVAIDQEIRFFDARQMKRVGLAGGNPEQPFDESRGPIHALAACSQQDLLASATPEVIRIYRWRSGKKDREIPLEGRAPNILAFDSEGNWLAAGFDDRRIVIWPLK